MTEPRTKIGTDRATNDNYIRFEAYPHIAAMLEWIDAGWQLGEFSSRSVHFFCTKSVELQTVEI